MACLYRLVIEIQNVMGRRKLRYYLVQSPHITEKESEPVATQWTDHIPMMFIQLLFYFTILDTLIYFILFISSTFIILVAKNCNVIIYKRTEVDIQ